MVLVPLFPLPNVVLFPGVSMPLHIFEPRYRAMVADALEGDRRIALVLLRPGWDADYEGRPAVYPVGCTGVISTARKLDDGRYTLVLQGLERVRVVAEDHARAYRRATLESLPDPAPDDEAARALRADRQRIIRLAGLDVPGDEAAAMVAALTSMPDAALVHTLAHLLDFEPVEKQALLECRDLPLRAVALADLLEMRRLARDVPVSERPH